MSKSLTLGSFFDGIGGWLLAAKHAGVNPVWASEIDDFPATVSAHHFPQVKQLGDITKINVDELEPTDIICAGSPCQDLSVAGKREGLAGERSGLFVDAIKLVHGLRARTGKPRYFVWENVPGAFSSNKGHDFRAVLSEITKTEIPMPKDGRWAEAGYVEWGGTSSLAWRTLDAQYWGVPQRRKRIFLVADFGGFTAGEILFVEQGLPRDSSESEREREETATDVGTSIDSAIGVDIYNNKITGDKVTALTTNNTSTSTAPKVMTSIDGASGTLTPWDVQSNRIQGINGKAAALYGGAGQGTHNGAVFDTRQIDSASGFKYRQGAKAGGIGWQNGIAPTLELSQNCAVYDISHRQDVIRPQENGTLPCLTARAGTGGNNLPVVHSYCNVESWRQTKTVRRLTPLEAERLQGLPDGYTDIEFNGKPAPDSRRYKALGNGMAQPCADYAIRRIMDTYIGNA